MIIFISILLVIAAVWMAVLTRNSLKQYNYIGQSLEQKNSITITGQGKVIEVPDIAKIQLGHSVEKKSVAQAQKENTEKMNAVIKKLKEDFKIDEKDIKTVNYNIYPQYDWNDGRQTLRGYQVSQTLSVKIRELERVSNILDEVGRLGLNEVGGLSFEIDEPEKLRQEARELAIKNSKEKAEALAKIAGVKLGKIISFSEYAEQPSYEYDYTAKGLGVGGGGAAPAVEAGSTEITVMATVEYEIY